MKTIWLSLWLGLGVFGGLLLPGCSQQNSTVGSDLTPGFNGQSPQEIYLDPDTTLFYSTYWNTAVSPFLYVGSSQGYSSYSLLKFNPNSLALPDSYQVDSLILQVWLDSIMTPGAESLAVALHLIDRVYAWTEIGVTWANMDTFPEGEFLTDAQIASPDTGGLGIPLFSTDSLWRAWVSAASSGKTLDYNNGLRLTSGLSMEVLLRLKSGENNTTAKRPKLFLYLDVYDSLGTQIVEDSLFSLLANSDAFVTNYTGSVDSSYLYLGNAVAYRSLFLFNFDSLFEDYYNIAVQRAELVLRADTTLSSLNYDAITGAYPQAMEDSTWLTDPVNADPIPSSLTLSVYNAATATLTINLTSMVYDWIRYPGTHRGLMVRSSTEYYNIARQAFYGVNAPDSTLQPRLRIVYLEGVQ